MSAYIKSLLTEAYQRLGIQKQQELDDRVQEAMDHLQKDRERYIEVGKPGEKEYTISTNHGVICRQVPLAYLGEAKKVGSRLQREVIVLSLIVTDTAARYIFSYYRSQLQDDPTDIVYNFPVHYFARETDITPDLHATAPQRILPAATSTQWNIYRMIFTVMATYCKHLTLKQVPHKTERAFFALDFLEPETVTVDGKTLTGKLLPLAQQESLWDELREDHRYSKKQALCLLVREEGCQYLLKTIHIYQYFKKEIFDDVPGGCAYHPTKNKQEVTWQIISSDAFPKEMYALYN